MTTKQRYDSAKEMYKNLGVDADQVLEKLKTVAISMHCWQGDDVAGFEGSTELSGGIQATGNYMGKARNPEELMADIDKAARLARIAPLLRPFGLRSRLGSLRPRRPAIARPSTRDSIWYVCQTWRRSACLAFLPRVTWLKKSGMRSLTTARLPGRRKPQDWAGIDCLSGRRLIWLPLRI